MKLYGLIGYPLGHSFSKQYFTDKFEREGLADCFFEAFPIKSINEFSAIISANSQLKGLGVTIPYKELVLPFVDELSEEVKSIGATNSIKVARNKLIAYNTDITGFEESFTKLLQPYHSKALVLGEGGASKAVQYVLNKLGIPLLVVTRKESLINAAIHYNNISKKIMDEYKVIINCTPAGMYPNENIAPNIPYHLITEEHYLYDLVINQLEPCFYREGKKRALPFKTGMICC